MPVFTILNHGTAFDRSKTGELIADLGRVVGGQEARVDNRGGEPVFVDGDYMINEGPGSDIATRPGAVNPYTMAERKTGYTLAKRTVFSGSGFKKDFLGNTEHTSGLMGKVAGSGWDDNIAKTMFILSNKLDNFPRAINMIGWSRGAVTCLRLASAFHEKVREGLFPPLSLNLFLVDPVVGGPTSRETGMDHIAPLVDRMVAILSMHERRPGFSPLSADKMYKHREADSQDIVYLPMPGVHADQVKKCASCPEAADITWNLAYKFLSTLGTSFRETPQGYVALNDAGSMSNAYARLVLSATGLPLINRRNFAKHLDRYIDDHDYFINKHHQLVFERAFPDLYRSLFCGAGALPASSLVNAQRLYPDVVASLLKAGVVKDGQISRPKKSASAKGFSFSWPRGIPLY